MHVMVMKEVYKVRLIIKHVPQPELLIKRLKQSTVLLAPLYKFIISQLYVLLLCTSDLARLITQWELIPSARPLSPN